MLTEKFHYVPERQSYHTALEDSYMGVVFRLPGSKEWLWAVTRDAANTAAWHPAKTLYGARIACSRALAKQRGIVRQQRERKQQRDAHIAALLRALRAA